MTTLGIIPARKESERFPGKHHALLLGKSMFAYTLEAALEAKRLDRLVVSSDDLELKPLAEHYGVEFIQRPKELSSVTSPLEEALRHACGLLAERDGFQPDLVVTMQGNVPVRKAGQIDELIERLERMRSATAMCTAQVLRVRPEWAKVIVDERTGEVAPFLLGHTGYRAQDYPTLYAMDGAIYGVRHAVLMALQGRPSTLHAWFGERLHVLVQDHPMYSLEVDYPDQVPLAVSYLLYQRYGERWCEQFMGVPVAEAHP